MNRPRLGLMAAMVIVVTCLATCAGRAQETSPTPAPAPAPTAAPAEAQQPAATDATPPVSATSTPQVSTSSTTVAPKTGLKPATEVKGGLFSKKEKIQYTGPTEVIVLPPAPMLDEEGKQRLDPEGKPMFFPPVQQQRDKFGHPLFDESKKPVMQTKDDLGYDIKGKKIPVKKEKPPKTTPLDISRGVYTVDGMAGKMYLNYSIADIKYLYFWAPGVGIAVVSNEPFAGAVEQKKAFNDKTLTVSVADHTLQLASDKRMLGKEPSSAYVMLDRQFTLPSRYPVMGYGTVVKAPYQWPGSKPNPPLVGGVAPPPAPKNLLPVQLLKPCPAGQMRIAGPPVLPGQKQPDLPCVAIAKAIPHPPTPPAPPTSTRPSAPGDAPAPVAAPPASSPATTDPSSN